MKKLMLLIPALLFFVVAGYAAQTDSSSQSSDQKSTSAKSSTANPLRSIAGKISDDGKTFTADKDGKQWTIKNPDEVKGHEGHHVRVRAHVNKDTNELDVTKVTMLGAKGGKKSKAASSSPSS
jgi:hypothetical protein